MHGMTSAFLGIGYGYGFSTGLGVGARFEWVFLPDGALKLRNGMHDEIGVEAGFDYFHAGYDAGTFGGEKVTWSYNEFTPVVGIVWNFWLTDKLALYPKIDLGYRIASWSESVSGSGSVASASPGFSALYFQGAGGIVYRAGPVALRAEAGWEALRLGAGIDIL